ncbi:transglutaminase-like putative cysteine protease [Salsuginibacillus halophilus]|uniref:Transglutaminase-like putative cysteine protease n=1 Tax=Salsuginibacillus halophilus TaxID=517424 RepID=A0A2P8H4W0_9BACI|nr:transglutaminase domain-containing protein [Salsuginibacillus halophilus]PSL41262.1 transglutaminase-like putative cysteine protease [Salsuginibacillus halophilus]
MKQTLERSFTKRCRWIWSFTNRQSDTVRYWLPQPIETSTQGNITCHGVSSLLQSRSSFPHDLLWADVDPGDTITINYEIDLYRLSWKGKSPSKEKETVNILSPLSEKERDFYLRSTVMSPVNEDMRQKAKKLTAGAKTEWEKIQKIYTHIVSHMNYQYPPKQRGASFMSETRRGDCGEFSLLFTSYCRSLGIPARTLFGAWANEAGPHAWNEVYYEPFGWLPVDTSIANNVKKLHNRLFLPFQMGVNGSPNRHIGESEGNRIAFSVDANLELTPSFEEVKPPEDYPDFPFGVENFYYGFQTHDGTAPYLQPGYIQFNQEPEKMKLPDILGNSNIQENGIIGKLRLLKQSSFILFLLVLFTEIAARFIPLMTFPPYVLSAAGSFFLCLYVFASLLRREGNRILLSILILVVTFFFIDQLVLLTGET